MATTTTTNIKLVKPDYSEAADVQVLNGNADKIDAAFGETYNDLGIVVDGNKSALSAAIGEFVILKNSTISGRSDGLYTAAKAIPANTAIDSTYLTAVSGGGLNHLSKYVTLFNNANGINYDETATLSEAITNFRYLLLVFRTNTEYATQLIPTDTIPVGRSINQSFFEHNVSEGQVTYPLYYSTSANFTITSATTIKCTMQVYTNSNLKAKLTKVIGIGRIN